MSTHQGVRQGSVSELLEYSISFKEDNTLEWNPPVGSKELAIALSNHFPKEERIEKKMQAATMKYLRAEHQKRPVATTATADDSDPDHGPDSGEGSSGELLTACGTLPKHSRANIQTDKAPSSNADDPPANMAPDKAKPECEDKVARDATADKLKIVSWGPGTKVPSRGKKCRYESEERVRVASNRGYACDEHRKQKVKCDPDICPRNKRNLLAPLSSPKHGVSSNKNKAICSKANNLGIELEGMSSDQANRPNPSICPMPDQPALATPFSPLLPDPANPVRIGLSEVDMAWQTFPRTPLEFSLFDSTFIDDQKAFEESVDKFYFPVVPHCDWKFKPVDPTLSKLHQLMGGIIKMKLDDA